MAVPVIAFCLFICVAARRSAPHLPRPSQHAHRRRHTSEVRSFFTSLYFSMRPHRMCRPSDNEHLRACLGPLILLAKHSNPEVRSSSAELSIAALLRPLFASQIAELSTALRVSILSRFPSEDNRQAWAWFDMAFVFGGAVRSKHECV